MAIFQPGSVLGTGAGLVIALISGAAVIVPRQLNEQLAHLPNSCFNRKGVEPIGISTEPPLECMIVGQFSERLLAENYESETLYETLDRTRSSAGQYRGLTYRAVC